MLSIAYYFLQVALCSGVMMGYYWLVLRNKRFHQYNRFYLLGIALLAWIVPLIKITWSRPAAVTEEQPQMMQFLSVVADNNTYLEQTVTRKTFQWSWDLVATCIYIGVAAILLVGMIGALLKLYRLLKHHSCKNVGDVYLVLTKAKGTPFSFFRYIFWNEEIDIRTSAGKQILQHELTHVKQKHTFDRIFMQLVLIGGWFNPFFWLMKKEMEMIHEFIADKKAVESGDVASLAEMLLTAAYPQQKFALAQPFFFSPIKRRIQMLTNNRNPRFSYVRRLIVLPLLAVVTVLFAFRNKQEGEPVTLSLATVMEDVADAFTSKIVHTDKEEGITIFNNASLDRTYTVVIDAGHGGNDKGTIAPDGTAEVDLVVPLAKAIRELNTNDNIRIELVNSGNESYNAAKRTEIANGYHPDLFISLHSDALDTKNNPSLNGIEIFIPSKEGTDYAGSEMLANTLMTSFKELDTKLRGIKTRSKKIHVLENVQSPAVLIETGFLSDADDLKKMKDEQYRRQMAASILRGINNYLRGTSLYQKATAALTGDTAPNIRCWQPIAVAPARFERTGIFKLGAEPLVILDGQKIKVNSFADLKDIVEPDQIQTITVHNAATAMSTFGEEGKNGALYISTKNPKLITLIPRNGGPGMITRSFYAKDPLGNIVKNRTVFVRGILYKGPGHGTKVWDEKITVQANEDGQCTILIGKGKNAADGGLADFSQLEWGTGTNALYLNLHVAVSPSIPTGWWTPDANYIDQGTVKLNPPVPMSVGSSPDANGFLITDSTGNVNWALPKQNPSANAIDYSKALNLQVANGEDITLDANTVAVVEVKVGNVEKGDPIVVTPQIDYPDWSVYSASVSQPGIVKLRLANYTDKQVTVKARDYKIVVIKYHESAAKAVAEPAIYKSQETPREVTVTGYSSLAARKVSAEPAVNKPQSAEMREVTVTGYPSAKKNDSKPDSIAWIEMRGGLPVTWGAGKVNYLRPPSVGFYAPAEPAVFPGGEEALEKFVARNINYDLLRRKGAAAGKYTVEVMIAFAIDGKVRKVRIDNDPGFGAGDEAARIFTEGPQWTPAKSKDGISVNTVQKQLVTFTIAEGSSQPMSPLLVSRVEQSSNATVPPSFPGGIAAWTKYLQRNLNSKIAEKNGAPVGRYTVSVVFDVAENGSIGQNIRAENDPGYGTKNEAIRIIQKGPRWKPATKDGKNISATHKVNIGFSVNANQASAGKGWSQKLVSVQEKINQLKKDNDRSFFTVDGKSWIVLGEYGFLATEQPVNTIFMNGERITIDELNTKYKRSQLQNNLVQALPDPVLSKAIGEGVFILSTKPYSNDKMNSMVLASLRSDRAKR